MSRANLLCGLTLALMLFFTPRVRADHTVHSQVVVFIPAYEGSKLYDPTLAEKGDDPPCVWGSLDAFSYAWRTLGQDAILQPPKPSIEPSARILQRAEYDAEPEAGG